jgi:hypothetical protein
MRDVTMSSLMRELGYDVEEDPREQQFSCDLHGGRDSKPSARLYPDSNSTYCFACAKSRTPISLLMDKREIGFAAAVSWIERWANLPVLDDPGEDAEEEGIPPGGDLEPANLSFQRRKTETLLRQASSDRALNLDLCLRLWEAFDLIVASEQESSWKMLRLAEIEAKILGSLAQSIRAENQ